MSGFSFLIKQNRARFPREPTQPRDGTLAVLKAASGRKSRCQNSTLSPASQQALPEIPG